MKVCIGEIWRFHNPINGTTAFWEVINPHHNSGLELSLISSTAPNAYPKGHIAHFDTGVLRKRGWSLISKKEIQEEYV